MRYGATIPSGSWCKCGAFSVARGFGYDGRALGILSATNVMATAAAMATFFLVMTSTVRASLLRSFGWTFRGRHLRNLA